MSLLVHCICLVLVIVVFAIVVCLHLSDFNLYFRIIKLRNDKPNLIKHSTMQFKFLIDSVQKV